MRRHHVLPAAMAELEHAAQWYADERPGLGLELVAAYRERLELALTDPGAGTPAGTTPAGHPIRRYRLGRFKRYAILLAEIDGVPTVLAFEHSSRRPGYWRDRIGE